MNVLITGGTGFIGSRLALNCLAKGDTVRVLGQENNPAEAENKKRVEAGGAKVILGSVVDRDLIFETMKGIDLVFHLAAAQHEANVPDQRFWDVNVTGTKNMLESGVKAGVKRFVHGSTIGVYGSQSSGILSEESPKKPDNIYGITKLEGEKLALSFQERLPVVIIRISETYGPGDWRLLKLYKAIKKKIFFLIGNGKNMHHPVFIDDLIQGLLLASTVEEAAGKTFVLAGKEPLSTNEMVVAIADSLGTKVLPFRAPLRLLLLLAHGTESVMRPLGIQPPLHRRRMDFFRTNFMFSIEKAVSLLGYAPQFSFRQGIDETAKWYTSMNYL